jgi:hypothetical protein
LGLTPAGLAIGIIGLVLLIRSLSVRNSYEIVLSTVMLVLWGVLFVAGIWGKKRLQTLEPQWKPPSPFTAKTEEDTLVSGFGFRVPWFFRLHVLIRGRFFPSGEGASFLGAANLLRATNLLGEGCPVFMETTVPQGANSVNLRLSFPMSGIFRGESSCRLRDVFGLFSFFCGITQQRNVNIMCAPITKKTLRIDPESGAEDRRNKSSDDEERYYMREYAPGDRFRDINWKSSEKIDMLITRISPDTNEKVCRIEVYFRNYGRNYGQTRGTPNASLDELWLLDRAKARLSQFLRFMKESDDSYVFLVHTAQGSRELEDSNEIEAFLEELAGIPFSPSGAEYSLGAAEKSSASWLYVFSTACDAGLSSFISACHPRRVFLFFTEAPDRGRRIEETETEILAVRDFPAAGCYPSPKLMFRRNKKQSLTPGNAARIERDYSGVTL